MHDLAGSGPSFEETAEVGAVLDACTEVAVLPQVAFNLVEVTSSRDATVPQVARAIQADPGLSYRVLSEANSEEGGSPGQIGTIHEAVEMMGITAVRKLSMTLRNFDQFVGKNDPSSLRKRAWWRHSLDSAVSCAHLAGELEPEFKDLCATCGLLVYYGKNLLNRFDVDKYNKVDERVQAGSRDTDAEQEQFGCKFTEVNAGAAARGGFPQAMVDGLWFDNEPEEGSEFARIRAITGMGHQVAKIALEGRRRDEWHDEDFPQWMRDTLELADNQLKSLVAESMRMVMTSSKAAM